MPVSFSFLLSLCLPFAPTRRSHARPAVEAKRHRDECLPSRATPARPPRCRPARQRALGEFAQGLSVSPHAHDSNGREAGGWPARSPVGIASMGGIPCRSIYYHSRAGRFREKREIKCEILRQALRWNVEWRCEFHNNTATSANTNTRTAINNEKTNSKICINNTTKNPNKNKSKKIIAKENEH